LKLVPPPIGESLSYVSRIDREKIAHVVEGKEGFAPVFEQPELGFDKFAPSVEGGLKQVSLKAVDRFAKNSGHEAAKRFGLSVPAPFSAELPRSNQLGSKLIVGGANIPTVGLLFRFYYGVDTWTSH
jgi:hypothetical protein